LPVCPVRKTLNDSGRFWRRRLFYLKRKCQATCRLLPRLA
jgi:hypothetical protein